MDRSIMKGRQAVGAGIKCTPKHEMRFKRT